jgi:NAD(P) transhydrogenase subunit alpha
MAMIVSVPKETARGERRVALVPDLVGKLVKAGLEVVLEPGAGTAAGFPDAVYQQQGASFDPQALERADILLHVQPPTAAEVGRLKQGVTLIGFLQPYTNAAGITALAGRQATAFSVELMPRITRAQSMDALSAMSTVAGYKAVVLAASYLPKFFPLLMTAAGTVTAARVFVLGAGVAGLQAIGTAKRLGAVIEAYDTRPAVKEQVESLGGKFVELPLATANAEDKSGYARAQTEEFYQQQRQLLGRCVAAADVVITTALVPGRRAPVLITEEMVQAMRPGSVVVDLAAEQGGNCAVTRVGEDVNHNGVLILGPANLPSSVPYHASQMYARTQTNYLLHLVKDGKINLDLNDELTRGPLVLHNGQVVHEVVKATLSPQGPPA